MSDDVMPDDDEILRRSHAPESEYIDSDDLHKIIAENATQAERERALEEFFEVKARALAPTSIEAVN